MNVVDDRRRRFELLFELHYRDVKGFVLRRAPRANVDDALAETFLIAWRRLDDIDADPLPWLFGVARRVLANQQRAERRRFALVDRLRREPMPAAPPTGVLGERLGAALTALSAREREALLLIAWRGEGVVVELADGSQVEGDVLGDSSPGVPLVRPVAAPGRFGYGCTALAAIWPI
jgi:RNA polymerase sigma-70 factor (ECF subfamily)